MAPRWTAAYRPPLHDLHELSVAYARGSAALYPRLPEDVPPPSGAGAAIRDGPEQSPSVDSCPLSGAASDAARPGGCPHPVRAGLDEAPRGGRGQSSGSRHADGGALDPHRSTRGDAGTCLPPFSHDGTERRIERPQDSAEQTRCYSGKKKCHTVKNVLLINAALRILFLSDTYAGSTHDKRIADATPYPLPAGSRLLQDLGFLAFTLPQVEMIMPTKKPRGRKLTQAQKAANRRIARRRVRIEHVNSSVKGVVKLTFPLAQLPSHMSYSPHEQTTRLQPV